MMDILNKIKTKYCEVCHVGAPSKLIGYKSSGTCLDYAYDILKVPYAFAWEIYTDEKELPELQKFRRAKDPQQYIRNALTKTRSFLSVEEGTDLLRKKNDEAILQPRRKTIVFKSF